MATVSEAIRAIHARLDSLEQNAADHDRHIMELKGALGGADWDDEVDVPVDTGPAPIEQDLDAEIATIRKDLAKEHASLRPHRIEGDDVIMPSPTPEQKKLRKAILENLAFENLDPQHGLSKEAADAAYVEGGPFWLWLFDREYMVQMPSHVKQIMVNDILRVDPETAHELGRDILKDETGVDMDTKIDQILTESENANLRA